MLDEILGLRVGVEKIAVWLGKSPEGFLPFFRLVNAISIINRVAGLVAQRHHELMLILQCAVHLIFNFGESGVRVIERNANNRNFIGTAPGIRKVTFRLKDDPFSVQLCIKLLN